MKIREEEEKDYFLNENLTREAFWNVYQPGCYEHYVLHKMRKDPCYVKELSYVMEADKKLIASIACVKAKIKNEKTENEVLVIGPIGVLPEYQGAGYGSKLMKYTLKNAKKKGYTAVVLTGNPEYYERFGFKPASKYRIYYTGMENEENPFFMIKVFNRRKMKKIHGSYQEPEVYLVDKKELEEFDKKFPLKKKRKKEE